MSRNNRKLLIFPFFWLGSVLCLPLSHAQEPEAPLVLQAPTGEGQMLVMAVGERSFGETLIEDVRLSVDVEDGLQVFKAYHRGRTYTAHVALDGPTRHLAFDPKQGRFREILSSVRIELEDYGQFEEVVKAVGGTGGKVYAQLGFAHVRLPDSVNPAEVISSLDSMPGVKSARLQLRGPIYVPM